MIAPTKNKVCVVIRETSRAAVERAISLTQGKAGVVELRLDYLMLNELTLSNVSKWVRLANCPVILTLRREQNGGEFLGSETEQLEISTRLVNSLSMQA